MNYKEWNDCIAHFLFNKAKKDMEVFLYVTKRDIIQIYKERNSTSVMTDEEIWKDFIEAINNPKFDLAEGVHVDLRKDSYIEKVKEAYRYNSLNWYRNEKYPLYLTFALVLVIPLVEALNESKITDAGYYDKVRTFFSANLIKFDENDFCTASFRKLFEDNRDEGKIDILLHLQEWTKNHQLGIFEKPDLVRNRGNRWVHAIYSQVLISESDTNRLKLLFSKLELPPDLFLSSEDILRLYKKDEALNVIFKGNTNKRDLALKTAESKLVSIFEKVYNNWDGKTFTKIKKNNTSTLEENGTVYPLYLTLRFPGINAENKGIILRHRVWYKNPMESPETLCFRKGNKELDEVYIDSDGWSNLEFSDLGGVHEQISLKDESNNVKAIYYKRNIILFRQYRTENLWVSKAKYEKGGRYYVLIHEREENIINWLKANAVHLSEYDCPESFLLYKIDNAEHSCNNCDLLSFKELREDCIVVDHDNNIVLSSTHGSVRFLNDFPLLFDIPGITEGYKVFAEFDKIDRKIIELKNKFACTWELGDNLNHAAYMDDEFRLVAYMNDKPVFTSQRKYSFAKCSITETLRGSCRDKFGEYVQRLDDAITQGLRMIIPGNTVVPVYQFAPNNSFTSDFYGNRDYILYALSSIGELDKKEFDGIVRSVVCRIKTDDNKESIEKGKFDLLSEYERLGFVNHDYYNKKHIITVNKPTLVLLPVRHGHRPIVENGVTPIHVYPIDSGYRAVLIGARSVDFISELERYCEGISVEIEYVSSAVNVLLPQQVILHTKVLDNLVNIAFKLNCVFQRTEILADSLFQNIPSIEEYTREILNEGNVIFDFPSDVRAYQSIKCLDYNNNLREKSTFDSQLDLVTYSPGSYQERTILWYKGSQYPIDKYWGYFVVMYLYGVKFIQFDKGANELRIPARLRFPKVYARAFSLMSSERPEVKCYMNTYYRCYKIWESPYNNGISIESILKKLNQL
ncbi:hypothetical protein M2459_001577 [Parabacteroides sp. PF5-5]|uniref:hypothetical protein n=1 Tax=unclassified Parabacteroides TaxID=2649774 RepID=UPI002476BE5B|nr:MULTISPECIES: hypothetical protein [unclassified Parabacteroides]MDH6304839.1 hypothetical protein [Parabacteroides sp. PH5-39]MDH6316075.1 hypothetical protein [Parabacteroides sp. PF5-13]MDH6319732.1 hypothetical protein [Parabacteroides sp. PH5-13]MDH6323463.1 hypothetical protein [Parabacteroides sp. PH5-8]MDH6327029.1 hypothetical protein [Parabacteroides sp. PH5-41]